MIRLYQCPNCGRDSAAFVTISRPVEGSIFDGQDLVGNDIRCPACSPTPGTEPHDYQPVMLGGVAVEPPVPGAWERYKAAIEDDLTAVVREFDPSLSVAFDSSPVCCGDAGDCGHPCGVA